MGPTSWSRCGAGARPALVEGAQDPLQHLQRPADRCTAATAWSGMYHHKDPEPLDLDTVRGYVEHYHSSASPWPWALTGRP
jgi:hypothetical protein